MSALNPSSTSIKPKGAVVNAFAPGGATVQPGTAVGSAGSGAPDLPNAHIEDLGATIPKSTEASMYSSRQIHVFQPTAKVAVKQTSVTVDNIEYYPIPHLKDWMNDLPSVRNKFARTRFPSIGGGVNADDDDAPGYNQMIHDDEYVLMDIVRREGLSKKARAFIRSGPRKNIVWKAGEVKAAIVTCGGLCPGLNDVISELFTTLYYNYGVDHIYGIRSGFRGFWHSAYQPWIELTPEKVKGIYELGGTVLGSSRGGFDLNKIISACVEKGVNQIYIIGGDGTHRAAQAIGEECKKRGLKICVVGIPKTIDNDLGVIDRSFGFSTAVTEARKAIYTAIVEATGAPNGIGLVQVMGRHAGYIAAHAVLAARQVDLCLIPEVKFPLHGPHGVLEVTENVLKRQGYAVIVVAEGAGMDLCEKSVSYDESGNKKLPEPGKFLQNEINKYFKSKKVDASVKYIDPSYMIRAVPADAMDAVLCQSIAQNAVHGAMAGLTGFTSGLVNNRTVLLPFDLIRATSPSYLNPDGRTWERVVSLTHQPRWNQTSKEEKAAKVTAKL